MELVTKSEFARRAAVSPAMVSKLIREGGPLEPALRGKKINIDHESVTAYVERRGKELTESQGPQPIGGRPAAERPAPKGNLPDADTPASDLERMTLPQLCDVFGTDERFKVWLTGRKLLTDIRTKELAMQQKAGKLVDRDLMVVGVFEPFDSAFRRLLTDASKAIATQAVAQVRAGATEEEVETLARDILSSHIRPAKQRALRALTKAAAVTDAPSVA